MGAAAGSDGNASIKSDQASIHASVMSPLVSGVILANIPRTSEDFAVPVPAIILCANIARFSVAGAALADPKSAGRKNCESSSILFSTV